MINSLLMPNERLIEALSENDLDAVFQILNSDEVEIENLTQKNLDDFKSLFIAKFLSSEITISDPNFINFSKFFFCFISKIPLNTANNELVNMSSQERSEFSNITAFVLFTLAAKDENLALFEHLLKERTGGNWTIVSPFRLEMFSHAAAREGQLPILKRLLKKDPNGHFEYEDVATNITSFNNHMLQSSMNGEHAAVVDYLMRFPQVREKLNLIQDLPLPRCFADCLLRFLDRVSPSALGPLEKQFSISRRIGALTLARDELENTHKITGVLINIVEQYLSDYEIGRNEEYESTVPEFTKRNQIRTFLTSYTNDGPSREGARALLCPLEVSSSKRITLKV